MKNWKTTTAGVLAALGVALTQLSGVFGEGDTDWSLILGSFVTIAGLLGWSAFTKDSDQ